MRLNFFENLHEQERVRLAVHRLDVAAGACGECGEAAPCQTANEAAEALRALGASLVEPDSYTRWTRWIRKRHDATRYAIEPAAKVDYAALKVSVVPPCSTGAQ